jgi:hypothetical protein
MKKTKTNKERDEEEIFGRIRYRKRVQEDKEAEQELHRILYSWYLDTTNHVKRFRSHQDD